MTEPKWEVDLTITLTREIVADEGETEEVLRKWLRSDEGLGYLSSDLQRNLKLLGYKPNADVEIGAVRFMEAK